MTSRPAATATAARKSTTARAAKTAPKAPISIIAACMDEQIFGAWFKDRASWAAWFCFLKVMFGLPIDDAEHRNSEKVVILDAIREVRAPFSPEAVVDEFASLLKIYGITAVSGDRYAGQWPRERFKVHGIDYQVSERTKNDIYRDLLPIVNSKQCDLLDHPRLFGQLVSLERRTARGGRDSIDHPPGAHDDIAIPSQALWFKRAPPVTLHGGSRSGPAKEDRAACQI